jgi:hypothetical protein
LKWRGIEWPDRVDFSRWRAHPEVEVSSKPRVKMKKPVTSKTDWLHRDHTLNVLRPCEQYDRDAPAGVDPHLGDNDVELPSD